MRPFGGLGTKSRGLAVGCRNSHDRCFVFILDPLRQLGSSKPQVVEMVVVGKVSGQVEDSSPSVVRIFW